MNVKDNRRVRMTKKMIKESFVELLKKGSFRSITVRELCTLADVNRATFYKYYTDIYALFDEIAQEFQENLNSFLSKDNKDSSANLTKALEYIAENKDICNIYLTNSGGEYVPESILSLPAIANSMESFSSENRVLMEYAKEFVINGSYRIILKWLNTGCNESASQIASIIKTLAGKCITL